MNGDLLWHNTLVASARDDAAAAAAAAGTDALDFAPLLSGLRPVVEAADLAICHSEVPVGPAGGPYRYYPAFAVPAETLDAVRDVGYDLCTTASNHSLDDGWNGLVRTLDALDARGLKHAGTARTAAEAAKPTIHTTAGGVRIGVVSGTYDTNGLSRPRDREWSVTDLNPDTLLRRAAATRAAGADVVLVALHAGDEYDEQPNARQRELAERLTASPDVGGRDRGLIGSGVHPRTPARGILERARLDRCATSSFSAVPVPSAPRRWRSSLTAATTSG